MLRKFLPREEYGRNVFTLMTGTSIAQAIPIAISPVLTRLYTPEDFGVFALYLAITSIITVIATGRFELAILLPRKESDAANIAVLTILIAAAISAAVFGAVFFFNAALTELFQTPSIGGWLYFIPLTVLFTGVYQSLDYWNNRQKRYKSLAARRIIQSATSSAANIILGLGTKGAGGLIIANILGQSMAIAALTRVVWKEDAKSSFSITTLRQLALMRRYKRFPKYMIPGQLANVASSHVPTILLAIFFGPAVAGFYSLAQRVLILPATIVGSAVGEVFRQEAAALYNKSGNCNSLFLKTLIKLILIASLPMVTVLLFGPWLFSFVFGKEWKEAGEIASLISIMAFFQFTSSPLSQTVLLARMEKLDMAWQFARLVLSFVSFYIGFHLAESYEIAITLYVISFSIMYVIHSVMQYKAAKGNCWKQMRRGATI